MGKMREQKAMLLFVLDLLFSQISISLLAGVISKIFVDPMFDPMFDPFIYVKKWYYSFYIDNQNLNFFYVIFSIILYFSLSCFFVWRVSNKVGGIFGMDVRTVNSEKQKGFTFLLMGYSPNKTSLNNLIEELKSIGIENVVKNVGFYNLIYTEKKTKPLDNKWQQNLRSAWHHYKAGTLKVIYVLDPDQDQFTEFQTYIQTALDGVKVIRISALKNSDEPFAEGDRSSAFSRSYENYYYVYEGLRRGLEMIRERTDLADIISKPSTKWASQDDVIDSLTCIDATAGQKTFSIAAAALTLNRPLAFSYVTTGPDPKGGEVKFYDTNLKIGSNSL